MDSLIRVISCPLCDIFNKKSIKTKLHYPKEITKLDNVEFVIIDSDTKNLPVVIWNEHIASINREQWGRMLYMCRKLFGSGITLKPPKNGLKEHLFYYIHEKR